MNNKKRIFNSFEKLRKATDKNLIATMERIWVENTPEIHLLNYWYYRYFTNEFEIYCIRTKYEEDALKGGEE